MTDATHITKWITLGRLDSIPVGRARYVEAAARPLCVVRTAKDEAVVFDDSCPHAGSSLSGGHVENGCLVCPLHQWPFRIADGVCADASAIGVRKYLSRVRDGVVELADPGPR